jgi:hypothetical protein
MQLLFIESRQGADLTREEAHLNPLRVDGLSRKRTLRRHDLPACSVLENMAAIVRTVTGSCKILYSGALPTGA